MACPAFTVHRSTPAVGAAPALSGEALFVAIAFSYLCYAAAVPAVWGFVLSLVLACGLLLAAQGLGLQDLINLEGAALFLLLPLIPVAYRIAAYFLRLATGTATTTATTTATATATAIEPEDVSIDSSTSLYNRSGFLVKGRLLLASCRLERRELTVAVFDCNDLVEAREIYGKQTTRKLVDRIVEQLTLAGERGFAARTGPTQFALALPMPRERATQIIKRVFGNPCRIEFGERDSEIVLLPGVMVESVPEGGSFEQMFAALSCGLVRVREQDQLRHRYLKRERERHSRPKRL